MNEVMNVMDALMAGMGLGMVLVLVTVVALLVLTVLGSVWFYRQLRTRPPGVVAVGEDIALGRLRERYTAGEIDEVDFERRLCALSYRS